MITVKGRCGNGSADKRISTSKRISLSRLDGNIPRQTRSISSSIDSSSCALGTVELGTSSVSGSCTAPEVLQGGPARVAERLHSHRWLLFPGSLSFLPILFYRSVINWGMRMAKRTRTTQGAVVPEKRKEIRWLSHTERLLVIRCQLAILNHSLALPTAPIDSRRTELHSQSLTGDRLPRMYSVNCKRTQWQRSFG